METGIIIHIASTLVRLIPYIIILIACILLLQKTKFTGALIMVIGQGILVIPNLFSFVPPMILHSSANLSTRSIGTIYTITNGINLIGSIAFAIGLLLVVKEFVKSRETIHN